MTDQKPCKEKQMKSLIRRAIQHLFGAIFHITKLDVASIDDKCSEFLVSFRIKRKKKISPPVPGSTGPVGPNQLTGPFPTELNQPLHPLAKPPHEEEAEEK